jgi:hypothetical protein
MHKSELICRVRRAEITTLDLADGDSQEIQLRLHFKDFNSGSADHQR